MVITQTPQPGKYAKDRLLRVQYQSRFMQLMGQKDRPKIWNGADFGFAFMSMKWAKGP